MRLENFERAIALDKMGRFTILALLSALGLFINSITLSSLVAGITLSSLYFLINSVFLGRIFFKDENTNFRVAFGLLLLITFIALGNAAVMFITAFQLFPLKFDIQSIVAILSLITIALSILNHIQNSHVKTKESAQK